MRPWPAGKAAGGGLGVLAGVGVCVGLVVISDVGVRVGGLDVAVGSGVAAGGLDVGLAADVGVSVGCCGVLVGEGVSAAVWAAAAGLRVTVGAGGGVEVDAATGPCVRAGSGRTVPVAGPFPPRIARRRSPVARNRTIAPPASAQPGSVMRSLSLRCSFAMVGTRGS